MLDYQIIINILLEVLNGKNLTQSFTKYISNTNQTINIAKIKDISYGVLRNYNILTAILCSLVTKKADLKIEVILLIGIYELRYSKKPNFAVTNEIVNLSYKITGKASFKSFINAVLRNYIRKCEAINLELSKDD